MTHGVSHHRHDFAHWETLPMVSCQCITFGRPHLLNEAVESFLQQDYPGPKELIILNDHPDVRIENHGIPDVHVVNVPRRFHSIGEKRNACCGLCSGDLIAPWDDDDISLPWRLSVSIARMTNHQYFRADRLWCMDFALRERVTKLAHAMSVWSRCLFDEVRGYPHIESGQDQAIESLFALKQRRGATSISSEDMYYIYRFAGTGSYHLSSHGWGRGMQAASDYVARCVAPGIYKLRPMWTTDYVSAVRHALQRAGVGDREVQQ
jgi:hypothetical protein